MTPTHEQQREFAVYVVRKLREAGHEALWAGGCVRDLSLNKTPKDYDVATSALPEQVQGLFRRTLAIGISFGVVQVRGKHGCNLEVATFRSDSGYSDGRRPDSVTFSSPQADAQRRDFTINGMFFDPIVNETRDYVGGREDLQRKIIRAIGNPRKRFQEDKLRLLRAVRFAATLGFSIERATKEAIVKMADQLNVVSVERMLAETRRMLCCPRRSQALVLLRETRLFEQLFPNLAGPLCNEHLFERTRRVLDNLGQSDSFPLATAALTSGVEDSAATAERTLRRLKASNDEIDQTVWLCSHWRRLDDAKSQRIATLKRLLAHSHIDELITLHEAATLLDSERDADGEYCRQLLRTWTAEEIDPPRILTGDDLVAAGFKPGRAFKRVLDAVRDEQLDGVITSKDQALALARSLLV